MWTSGLCNHTSEHHSPLSGQPDIVVGAVGSLPGSDRQYPAAAALDVDRQRSESPILNRAGGGYSAGPTRQRLTLDAALVRPHPPCRLPVVRRSIGRNEVDVRAFRRQRPIEPERPATIHQWHPIDVFHDDHEVRDADTSEYGPTFAIGKCEPADGDRRVDWGEPELGTSSVRPGRAAAIGPRIRLEVHAIRGS